MRVVVIGAGAWGKNHIKTLNTLPVDIIGVYELCVQTCKMLSTEFEKVKILESIDDISAFDAVIITAPTHLHKKIASFVLEKNIPCFIEKPLAFTLSDAESLVNIANTKSFPITVGHIERFNPVFVELKRQLGHEKRIMSIDVTRHGIGREGLDTKIDVIYDLMIHDIDLVQALLGYDSVDTICAEHIECKKDPFGYVKALLKYKSGSVVHLSSSRLSHRKVRTMQVECTDQTYLIDFIAQTLEIFKGRASTKESISIKHCMPLEAELSHFLDCVKNNQPTLVSLEDGKVAVDIAAKIKKACQSVLDSIEVV